MSLIGEIGRLFKKLSAIVLLSGAAIAHAQQTDPQETVLERQRAIAEHQQAQTAAAMSASIEKQKVSVRSQRASRPEPAPAAPSRDPEDFFVTESLIAPPSAGFDCDPLSVLEVQSLSERAGQANRVSGELIRAVMRQESGFRPCALSPAGAIGLMQLMPGTAAGLGVVDATLPEPNVFGGAKLLRQLMDRYAGNLNLVLGAYNAGPANVDQAGGVPDFPETLHYVDAILRKLTGWNPKASAAGDADPGIAGKPSTGN